MTKNLIWVALIVAAFVAGYEVGKRSSRVPNVVGGGPTIQAYIALQGDGSCKQTVGPDPEDYPQLSKDEMTTIKWMGNAAAFAPQVSFPAGGSPFAQSSFSGEADSGPVTRGTPINVDYPFSSLTVFDQSNNKWVPCNLNIHPMGVHVDH
jgi:hypothetical protein